MALTAIPVSEELKQKFASTAAVTPALGVRFLQVQIQSESLNLITSKNGTTNLPNDWNQMKKTLADNSTLDQPSYFLFHSQGSKFGWVLVTYLPEGCDTKNKMLYSSTKERLKTVLGNDHFSEEYLAEGADELDYSAYDSSKRPVDSRSEFEKRHEEILIEENQVREQRSEEITKHGASSGGYHSVAIPLKEDAKSQLEKLKSGECNLVTLQIDSANQASLSAECKTTNNVGASMHTSEPRFYVFKPATGAAVFIYCCPEKSPPKLRMVYSTAKPTVISQVEKIITLANRKVESSDPSEISEQFLSEEVKTHTTPVKLVGMTGGLKPTGNRFAAPAMGAQVRASNAPKNQNQAQHPIYGLMAADSPNSGKKKIVIPPRAAWNG